MTTLYLVRHSEPFKIHKGIEETDESLLFSNKKTPLSIFGEKLAEKVSLNSEFSDLDVVWSSDYARAMSTAKYFADRNGLKVNISKQLGERTHGINSWDELPVDFELHQFQDENYKIGNGESQKETKERMKKIINRFLNTYKNQKVLVVGHATAIAYLLKEWCEIDYLGSYKFHGEEFFDGNWGYCETFKLIFNEQSDLIDINNLKF